MRGTFLSSIAYLRRLCCSLGARQKFTLGLYLVALPILLATLLLLNTYHSNQRKQLAEEYRILEWLTSLPDFDREKAEAVRKVKETSLAALVIESAGRDSIVIDRINPKGDAEISCSISATTFDQFIGWAEKFSHEHPYINLIYIAVNKISAENQQLISVSFTLTL